MAAGAGATGAAADTVPVGALIPPDPLPLPDAIALPLFVYGSLRSGQRAHRGYCRKVLAITPAQLWGRRRWLPSGYPILILPGAQCWPRPAPIPSGMHSARRG